MEIHDVVKVNNITSGKLENGVFSFTYGKNPSNGKQVKYLREGEIGIYKYKHHISTNDLEILNLPDKRIYQNKYGKSFLKNWGQDVKQEIARRMKEEGLLLERELENGKKAIVKFVWDGEIPKEFLV
ncbi:hypothetical protein [Bacillus sp. FJAT-27445]|uniref:hypothetical protein n=1 Tax=Bacillus sp. FJAT-27445 TaxID=1679166 RepID=UPI000743A8BB|nr:hypothetical protein [Bacillus sp. FJAT-27445]